MNKVFDQISTTLDQLAQLLEEEAEKLKHRDIDDLDLLLTEKREALQAVADADQQRTALLIDAGHAPDATGMRSYLDQLNNPALQARWQQIVAQLQHIQILNEANGRVIHRSLEQTEQMLDLFRGEESLTAPVYESTGQTKRSSGKTISRA